MFPTSSPGSVHRRSFRLRLTLALSASCLVGLLAALDARSVGTRAPYPLAQSAEDTVFIYGPQQYDALSSGSAHYVEAFWAATFTNYTLRVENGSADGSGRVDSAAVYLNGELIVTPDEFRFGDRVITRAVQPRETKENTLVVDMAAGAGTFFILSIYTTPDPTVTVYGPLVVEVPARDTRVVTDSFSLPANVAPPHRLHLDFAGFNQTGRPKNTKVTLNGETVVNHTQDQIESIIKEVQLLPQNTFTIEVHTSKDSSAVALRFTATDSTPPVLTISSPSPGLVTNALDVEAAGTIQDQTITRVTVNELEAAVTNNSSFSVTVPLGVEGQNTLQFTAIDGAGNRTDSTRTVLRDTELPVITINEPADGLITRDTVVTVSGTIQDLTEVTANLNGVPLTLDGAGGFSVHASLVEGENFLTVSATDAAGNGASVTRLVIRDTQPPVLTVLEPTDGATTEADSITVSGTVVDATPVTVTANGVVLAVVDTTFSGRIALVEGTNTITTTATDAAGNSAGDVRTVTRGTVALPPDPATVASETDPTVSTTLAAATEFLYTGDNPIQTGVDSGTIEPVRAAVLRGKVLMRSGDPLSGVEIAILGHPEFGSTLSRADGMFDMAVNGGGVLTVNYEKSGFLPAQRPLDVPWQDFALVDDVVMIAVDTIATVIDFSDPVEVARGSVVTDDDGARQATVFFEQGTQATMVFPDGTTQPLTSITVRATEYTVGASGPNAMPAPLPPTSAYTYAVELSADEAISAGARELTFSQPVSFYLENFLGFPVGTIVPAASYDRQEAAWIPSRNGRVVEIVSVTAGGADLDTNGDGLADGTASLDSLGVSDAERQQLAAVYAVGQELWRVEVTHFSPHDLNWPEGLPDDARTANVDGGKQKDEHVNNQCDQKRSIIGCQNQSLGEAIAVVGTPFALRYDSRRVPGRRDAYALEIPLSGSSVPASLKRIELEVQIAGRLFIDTFPALPNQSHTFLWDGKDVYGRVLQGRQPVTTRIGYVYDFFYVEADTVEPAFGMPSGSMVVLRSARRDEVLWQTNRAELGNISAILATTAAGWTLDAHHLYDVTGRILHRGDGTRRSADGMFPVITRIAGTGQFGDSGDGGPAIEARIQTAPVVVAPDGSILISGLDVNRVRRIGTDGIIRAFAGTGAFGFAGDGGPATEAEFNGPDGLAVGPDGSVYVADVSNWRIRRISPDGIITTVAGNGTQGFGGDGGPAIEAALNFPVDVATAQDGTLYIADAENNRIRRVDGGGIISTFAGNGTCDAGTEGLPATQATICVPLAVAIGPEGDLYVSATRRVWRIGPDGIVRRVAGTGGTSASGDGGLATEASIGDLGDIEVGADGSIYLVDNDCCTTGPTIRKVSTDGIIGRLAGGGLNFDGEGGPATQVFLGTAARIGLAPDGAVYIPARNRVRRVGPAFPGLSTGDFALSSEDGSELYIFSAAGRHLRTLDPLTGTLRLEFSYDSVGRLTQLTDGDSLVTVLERDTAGTPMAIVGPFGQRTTLTVDTLGRLATVANPAGETIRLDYTPDALLTTFTDLRANVHTFAYDTLGRLVQDSDPVGGFVSLSRTEFDTAFEVQTTSALGRTTSYRVEQLATGDERRINADPAGLMTTSTRKTDGSVTMTSPDGTTTTLVEGPDPRFGMAGPILNRLTVTTPNGLSSTVTASRRVTLADPSNPLSLLSLIDTVIVNGRVYTSTYDQSLKQFTNLSPEGRSSIARIDSLGRPAEQQLANLQPMQYVYDTEGRLSRVTQGSRAISLTYDPQGRLLTTTDPLARVDSFFYDPADRLVRQVLPDGREVRFGYDSAGNLVSVTPPGRPAHTFAHDAVDLDTLYLPPELETGPTPTGYAYNLDRQVTQVLRPDGETITFSYDSLSGRLQTLTTARGSFGYGYEATTGRLSRITTPEADTLAFTYDGTVVTRQQWAGRVAGSVAFGYDGDFRVNSLVVNGADTTRLVYDGDGLLTSAEQLTLTRDPATGLLTSTTLDSVVTRQGYNGFGELVADTAFYGATPLYATTVARDSLGRIRERVETVEGVTSTYVYIYDDVGRLLEVTKDGVAVETYEYDANGNRTRFTGPSGSVTGTYDSQDRLLAYGNATYTYTAAGELETKVVGTDTTRYSYDALGNLLSVRLPDGTLIEYVIDGGNRRVGKKVNGVLVQSFLYQDQLNPVAELDGSGQVVARFVYGSKANVPGYIVRDGVTYRLVSDHLGTVRLVVNSLTGEVAQRLDYGAFGRVAQNTNPGFQPFGFAGGLVDEQVGLLRFGARDYDSETGRWTAKDPFLFGAGDPNLYSYAFADPVNLVDADGKLAWFIPVALPFIGGAITAAANFILAQGSCVDPWEAAKRGFFSGFLGTAAAELATLASGNPLLGGAFGGLLGNVTDQLLGQDEPSSNDLSVGDALVSTAVGGWVGKVAPLGDPLKKAAFAAWGAGVFNNLWKRTTEQVRRQECGCP